MWNRSFSAASLAACLLVGIAAGWAANAAAADAAPPVRAEDPESPEMEGEEPQAPWDADEAEEKGIIPPGAESILSTGPVTPLHPFPERTDYETGIESLARAESFWKSGEFEAASDLALQAYDDLMEVRLPRLHRKSRNRKAIERKRARIRADRRKAASVYVHSSIDYLRAFVKQNGADAAARREGRERLEDIRDVAWNYRDLERALNKAIEAMK